jgi:hypothetical protein
VSRIRAVMSCAERRAFAKIFGPWKGSSAIEFEHKEICSRWEESKEAMLKDMRCAMSGNPKVSNYTRCLPLTLPNACDGS